MSYAVYHSEKGSISSGGIGNHIDRTPGAEHTYEHADPERLHLNEHIAVNEHCEKPLHVAISDRIKEGYSAKNKAGELKAIRSDAVKYTTHIFSGSPEQMKKIEDDPQSRKAWINANLEFAKKEFGDKNIVRFSVHRDEKTMHIHAVTVNLTEDGRLSAKEIIGNPKKMSERQDRYAAQVKSFGLERGEKFTGVKHENAKDYYSRINKAEESIKENDFKAQKNVLGVYKSESVEELQNTLKSQKTALREKDLRIEKLEKEKKADAKYKEKINERSKNLDEKLKYAVLSDTARERLKQEKINEIGKRYGSEVKQKFHFISHSIQQKTDEEISNSVSSAVKKIGEEKKLSSVDTALLMRSREVKEITEHLKNERERRNELDRSRGQNKGRGI